MRTGESGCACGAGYSVGFEFGEAVAHSFDAAASGFEVAGLVFGEVVVAAAAHRASCRLRTSVSSA
jgi:hypothetical protein